MGTSKLVIKRTGPMWPWFSAVRRTQKQKQKKTLIRNFTLVTSKNEYKCLVRQRLTGERECRVELVRGIIYMRNFDIDDEAGTGAYPQRVFAHVHARDAETGELVRFDKLIDAFYTHPHI